MVRPPGWVDESHSTKGKPNYDLVFPQGKVNRIDVVVTADDWQKMQDDLVIKIPKPPTGSDFVKGQPIFVPSTVKFEGRTWTSVGLRYKGNSTLGIPYLAGQKKLPFRLDFDEFEPTTPGVTDQRFWGFKALSLANNARDSSFLRDKVGGDLYRAAGTPTPRSAFYRLYVDFGLGPTYFGLYTVTEVPGGPMLDQQFGAGNGGGNLYKCDGPGAQFKVFNQMSFEKKSNEMAADWQDVMAMIAAINSPRTDAAAWRMGLEKVFNVDGFLKFLAPTTVMPNWDTYGGLPHNYYLYGHPKEGGRLHWIQWDNNEAMKPQAGVPLDLRTSSTTWPLTAYVGMDPVYRAAYLTYVKNFMEGPYSLAKFTAQVMAEKTLVAPYVYGPEGEQPPYTLITRGQVSFDEAVKYLIDFAAARRSTVQMFLLMPNPMMPMPMPMPFLDEGLQSPLLLYGPEDLEN